MRCTAHIRRHDWVLEQLLPDRANQVPGQRRLPPCRPPLLFAAHPAAGVLECRAELREVSAAQVGQRLGSAAPLLLTLPPAGVARLGLPLLCIQQTLEVGLLLRGLRGWCTATAEAVRVSAALQAARTSTGSEADLMWDKGGSWMQPPSSRAAHAPGG